MRSEDPYTTLKLIFVNLAYAGFLSLTVQIFVRLSLFGIREEHPTALLIAVGLLALASVVGFARRSWRLYRLKQHLHAAQQLPVHPLRPNGHAPYFWLLVTLSTIVASTQGHTMIWLWLCSGTTIITTGSFITARQRLTLDERGGEVRDMLGRRHRFAWDDVICTPLNPMGPDTIEFRDSKTGFYTWLGAPSPSISTGTFLASMKRYREDPVARLELIAPATPRRTSPPQRRDRASAG